jgi:NADH-quinone oxidoreductase chain I
MGILRDFIDGVYNLLIGLGVTAKRLPKPAVTLQYPDQRWPMPERSRGIVVLLSDKETGELNCTACLLCEKACPTSAITIEREKDEQNRWHAKSFTVDNTICCFCGLCEEACNFAAIKMATKYEFAVYNQSELVFDMKKLQEIGRDVPYEPIPKKKPVAPKPAEAPKTPAAAPTAPAANPVAQQATPQADTAAENSGKSAGKPESEAGS